MALPSNLVQSGKLAEFPAVELLKEASTAALGGAFHFESEQQKIAVYLNEGEVIFAASNVRGHRLAFKLLQWKAVAEQDLTEIINLPDLELATKLVESNKLSFEAIENYRARQVAEIIMTAFGLTTGEWSFNPLVRARENMRVKLDLPQILTQAARLLPANFLKQRFETDNSIFSLSATTSVPNFNLSPEEAYLLSRFDQPMNAETAAMIGGLPFDKICQLIYSLWLGGLLSRSNYQIAFDEATLSSIKSAKIAPSQKSPKVEIKTSQPSPTEISKLTTENKAVAEVNPPPVLPEIPPEPEISEEEQVGLFLQRVEASKTHYQILGVTNSIEAGEVKKVYFNLAKQFHPDKFHSIGGETHLRLQNAFSRLAQAYETLKDVKNRELYDFKLSKQSVAGDKTEVSQFTPEEIYQSGVKELQGGNYNNAVAYLQRAAQLSPDVAEYQARLGQALAVNPKFRHQAEEKMQQAIRLDEKNAEWRLLLAEYYIAIGLNKRAEGELNRLLSIYPNHPLAQQMFANLR